MEHFVNIIPYAVAIGTLAFGVLMLVIPHLISPRSRGARREATYESGEPIIGGAWIQFHSYYYMYALVFMAFDVETAFLVPCVTVLRSLEGWLPVFEVVLFLAILSLSLVYALRKKVLEWT